MWCLNMFGKRVTEIIFLIPTVYGDQKSTRISRWDHSSVQFSLSATPWTAACQASLFFTVSWSLLKHISIESMMPSNHFILCCPLPLLPSIFPSIRVFSNELALFMEWSNYLSFSFSIYLSNEYFQGWFPLGLTCLTSLQSKGLSRVFSSTMIIDKNHY